ncbi:Prophage tail fibre N-terminal [Yersinia enterocolitica]|nr:Prophage tail fibre N-terminal [Yersinia enterocolitica]
MSVKISGALIDGAGIPMSGYQIILKARVNTAELVMRTIATITMEGNGGIRLMLSFFLNIPANGRPEKFRQRI